MLWLICDLIQTQFVTRFKITFNQMLISTEKWVSFYSEMTLTKMDFVSVQWWEWGRANNVMFNKTTAHHIWFENVLFVIESDSLRQWNLIWNLQNRQTMMRSKKCGMKITVSSKVITT